MTPPNTDIDYSAAHSLKFYAATKERRHVKWIDITGDVSLLEAMAAAMQASAFERAVFVRSLNGGFFYWSSTSAVFSSSLLVWIVAERQQNSGQKTS